MTSFKYLLVKKTCIYIYIYTSVLVLEEKSIKLPAKCQQIFMSRRLWPYVVCGQLIL